MTCERISLFFGPVLRIYCDRSLRIRNAYADNTAAVSDGEGMHSTYGKPMSIAMIAVAVAAMALPARAQDKAEPPTGGAPGVITQGSGNVSVGGQAAARKGDTTDQADQVVEGSSNVFINGKPAVTVGDRTGCGGVVVGGQSNVFVNGKPLARAGDLTSGCDKK